MFRFVAFLAFALLTSALPAEKIFEHELTQAIQEALAPYDPYTIDALTGLSIVTDHSSITFNAYSVEASGFAQIEVTNFVPPVPFVSHDVTMAATIGTLLFHTDSYDLDGTHDGESISASGAGSLTMNTFGLEVKFKSESVSLSPLSMCIQAGTLTMDLSVDSIDSALEGAGVINDDIHNDGPAFLEGVEQQLNANSDAIVDAINAEMCTSRRR